MLKTAYYTPIYSDINPRLIVAAIMAFHSK